ncbi:serine acetyltransferase [Actinomyces wuliandei]|uniref:serine acetyltransferase n=1 Tax=Actinomyces wuliandei TaxID=2057743 RepID=UPI0027D84EC3|nr:serine acetyltransferase [Actinomyces wuliandei]
MALIRSDLEANRGNVKALAVLPLFRATHAIRQDSRLPRPLRLLTVATYRFVTEGVLGVELRSGARVGPGLRLDHGVGLVVHDGAVLGSHVLLRHNVTIGVARRGGACPVIGDRVEFGAGAVVVGGITIGEDAHVGANAVVTRDVPPGGKARALPAVITGRGG